jgi:hypothetical protein
MEKLFFFVLIPEWVTEYGWMKIILITFLRESMGQQICFFPTQCNLGTTQDCSAGAANPLSAFFRHRIGYYLHSYSCYACSAVRVKATPPSSAHPQMWYCCVLLMRDVHRKSASRWGMLVVAKASMESIWIDVATRAVKLEKWTWEISFSKVGLWLLPT